MLIWYVAFWGGLTLDPYDLRLSFVLIQALKRSNESLDPQYKTSSGARSDIEQGRTAIVIFVTKSAENKIPGYYGNQGEKCEPEHREIENT